MHKRAKALGLWTCTALVMGNMIGSGIFLLPASLAVYGGISLLGWLFTAAGAWMLALLFAGFARTLPRAGGPYAYSRAGLGDFAGFLVAWGYYISLLTGNAAIAVAMVSYASVFWPALSASPALGALTAMGAIVLLTAINVRGVKAAGIVQLVTTVLKVTPLVAVTFFGLGQINFDHFQPFNLSNETTFGAITATAALTLWAFLGLESATVPADDVADADKTIPRATLLGTLLATILYVAATVAVMGLVSPGELAASDAPFADAASAMWGHWGAMAVAAGATISCFGALNGWTLNTGQIPAAAARDGVFPGRFGHLSRFGTPAASLVFSAVLVCLLIAANYTRGLVGLFTFAILLSTTTVLIPYVFSAVAQLVVTLRDGSIPPGGSVIKVAVVSTLAFLYSVWAVAGAGHEAVYWGFLLLLAGLPVYAWMLIKGKRSGQEQKRTSKVQ
ncbi:MAG: amino acid permease [Gammaproteobacteria bacterium]|nr:amino acid permease [Gammaproteobacteria bacterium]